MPQPPWVSPAFAQAAPAVLQDSCGLWQGGGHQELKAPVLELLGASQTEPGFRVSRCVPSQGWS